LLSPFNQFLFGGGGWNNEFGSAGLAQVFPAAAASQNIGGGGDGSG